MTRDLLFMDTVYIQALLNRHDDYHNQAKAIHHQVRNAAEVWITEAILIEVGNALSASNRSEAVQFIQLCYQIPNMKTDTARYTRIFNNPDSILVAINCYIKLHLFLQELTVFVV